MRDSGGVAKGEKFGGYWALIGYSSIRSAAADTSHFCSGQGATIPAFGNPIPAIPLEVDPPEHRNYRKLIIPALRPEEAQSWSDDIRTVANDAIDSFIERGSADLAAELAHHLPPVVIAKILGLPAKDIPEFVGWTSKMNRAAAAGDQEANQAAGKTLLRYVEEQVTMARDTGADHLIGVVANAEINGRPIKHLAAVGMVMTLIVAGHETMVNGIGSALWLIGSHHRVKQRLINEPGLIPAAAEEALRLESPVQMMARTVTRDLSVEGVTFKAGDKVGLVFGAGNHDPAKFSKPHEFDIDRDANAHLAFGHGAHRCVGEHLARAEMQISIEEVLRRIPDYVIDGEVQVGAASAMNRGPVSVPVSFTRGNRPAPG